MKHRTIEERYDHYRRLHYAGGFIPIPHELGGRWWMPTFTGKFRGLWNERDPKDPGPWRRVNNWSFGRS